MSLQVLCVKRFEDESEAVEIANSSEFGLAAAVMSSDRDRCVCEKKYIKSRLCSLENMVAHPPKFYTPSMYDKAEL